MMTRLVITCQPTATPSHYSHIQVRCAYSIRPSVVFCIFRFIAATRHWLDFLSPASPAQDNDVIQRPILESLISVVRQTKCQIGSRIPALPPAVRCPARAWWRNLCQNIPNKEFWAWEAKSSSRQSESRLQIISVLSGELIKSDY